MQDRAGKHLVFTCVGICTDVNVLTMNEGTYANIFMLSTCLVPRQNRLHMQHQLHTANQQVSIVLVDGLYFGCGQHMHNVATCGKTESSVVKVFNELASHLPYLLLFFSALSSCQ